MNVWLKKTKRMRNLSKLLIVLTFPVFKVSRHDRGIPLEIPAFADQSSKSFPLLFLIPFRDKLNITCSFISHAAIHCSTRNPWCKVSFVCLTEENYSFTWGTQCNGIQNCFPRWKMYFFLIRKFINFNNWPLLYKRV